MELVKALEDEYGIQIADDELKPIKGVGDAGSASPRPRREIRGPTHTASALRAREQVVITGRGVVTSLGETADGFFDALIDRRSGIADGVGACTEFDPEVVMTPKEARRADRVSHFALAAAQQAWDEASPDGFDPERAAVVVGTGVGGLETLERNTLAWLQDGERAVSPMFVPMMMPNAAAGLIAMRFGIQGPGWSSPPHARRAPTRSARPSG